jgi:hypothetical protein
MSAPWQPTVRNILAAAAIIDRQSQWIDRLVEQNGEFRVENGWLRVALRRYEPAAQNPFPLLSGGEIIQMLHPDDWRRACR